MCLGAASNLLAPVLGPMSCHSLVLSDWCCSVSMHPIMLTVQIPPTNNVCIAFKAHRVPECTGTVKACLNIRTETLSGFLTDAGAFRA